MARPLPLVFVWMLMTAVNAEETSSAPSATPCPEGWFTGSDTIPEFSSGKCYGVSSYAYSFTGCQESFCGLNGATLVNIQDEVQQEEIESLISSESSYWIGYFQPTTESDYQWTNGLTSSDYTHWDEGEPNDWCIEENCALIYSEAQEAFHWVDSACACENYCVCEYGSSVSDSYVSAKTDIDANECSYDMSCYGIALVGILVGVIGGLCCCCCICGLVVYLCHQQKVRRHERGPMHQQVAAQQPQEAAQATGGGVQMGHVVSGQARPMAQGVVLGQPVMQQGVVFGQVVTKAT